jgi:hypothetical protein
VQCDECNVSHWHCAFKCQAMQGRPWGAQCSTRSMVSVFTAVFHGMSPRQCCAIVNSQHAQCCVLIPHNAHTCRGHTHTILCDTEDTHDTTTVHSKAWRKCLREIAQEGDGVGGKRWRSCQQSLLASKSARDSA